ncbi:MAG: hypothetical protein QOH14_1409, partial [Pseudonocardiales bacterium]|nr:hypothetical protein [Pseudonocardiales bacterium]
MDDAVAVTRWQEGWWLRPWSARLDGWTTRP